MFLQQMINGLTIGSFYALVAVGYSMVFSVLELTNFAHMSIFILGGYIGCTALAGLGVSFPAAAVLAIGGCGAAGILLDRFALMPMRRRGATRVSYLICTIGLSTFIQNFIMLVFGSEAIPFKETFVNGQIRIGNAVVSYMQIGIVALTLVLMALTYVLVYKTPAGMSMRAIAQNPRAAKLMGINTDRIITFTFFTGSALATVAGLMFGSYYYSVDLQMGFTVGMKTFASAVLGGIGSLPGAVLDGFLIGILEALFAGYISSGFKDAVGFLVLIVVLLIRPSGLMGQKKVNKV